MHQRWFGEEEWLLQVDKKYSFFYHVHYEENPKGYYVVSKEWKCRQCGAQPNKGIRFMAATARLRECR